MPAQVFVCGMLRSGTSLAQVLLANHPDMVVAYQPFHQFHVDIKRLFLDEHGLERKLPLDDGAPGRHAERSEFLAWLHRRHFDSAETGELVRRATRAKGGGLPGWTAPRVPPGTFFQIRDALHRAMASHLACSSPEVVGSKEVLCEEYVPALLTAGVRCILIIRDPRAVIASANNGRYRQMVGDRYPLMMLIRLWRKSAAYWLRYRHDPRVRSLRYEDLVADPLGVMSSIAEWLDASPFPPDFLDEPLKDHAGRPWLGNSSFGDRPRVDAGGHEAWRELLDLGEQRFIAACAKPEMDAIGYPTAAADFREILDFREDARDVRESYLQLHRIDAATKREESDRLQRFGDLETFDADQAQQYFLFPEAMVPSHGTTHT